MSQWFCIRTAPQREFALSGRYSDKGEWVPGILERKGLKVFCPLETRWRRQRRKGKRKPVSRPLLPGYVFVADVLDWPSLLHERHVIGVIGQYERPWPISESSMRRLQAISENAPIHRKSVNQRRTLREGDKVEIMRGPFTGYISHVTGLDARKARILLNLFGQEREVFIPHEDLEAA